MSDDPISELAMLLHEVGAVVTFDPAASIAHPCWRCQEPGPHSLFVCGVQSGTEQPMRRPFCEQCISLPDTNPSANPQPAPSGSTRDA